MLARSLCRYLGDGVSVSPEVAPTRRQGAFPEGCHRFLASGRKEAKVSFPFPSAPGGRSGNLGLQPALAAGRWGAEGACPEAKTPPPLGRKKPTTVQYRGPAPVLIWAAGSGWLAYPTSLLPNLVVEVWQFKWREGSRADKGRENLLLKGPH